MNNRVDEIINNAILLSMDDEYHIYEPGAIAIKGNSIVAVGKESEILASYEAEENTDCEGKVLMPGIIDAHTHVPMTLLRGLADDLRLDVWLMGYMMPVEREFVSPDFVKLGTKIACLELIRSGVTTFADMYYFEESVAEATAEIGMRAICGQTVMKYQSPDSKFYEEALVLARNFLMKWKGHELIIPAITPHAPFSCTDEILKASKDLALEFDAPLHIHIAETSYEVESFQKEHGILIVPYLEKIGLFDAKVTAAHCVHINESEMHTLLEHNVGVSHNPSSNLKLASGFAPINKMLELGLNVGIGTDGTASNNDLDMIEEVRLAALVGKTVTNDPTAIPAVTALAMATRIGAKSLHIDQITGSLEVGKRADLIMVDINKVHNTPRFHRDSNSIYAQIIYAAHSSDVTDVMVNGKWLMKDKTITSINTSELMNQAAEYAQRIDHFLLQREKSVFSKLIAIGDTIEEESFEVQAKVKILGPGTVIEAIHKPEIEILYQRHYHEYDTYFLFEDINQGTLRYREDEFIDKNGEVSQVRYRLTLIGQTREQKFPSDVLLSRSRFLAPANHSHRFYREYFNPLSEVFIEKDRQRWRILFRGTEFYINIDRLDEPDLGFFLEVKSRTWSQRDAEHKARLSTELIEFLGASADKSVSMDYIELATDQE
jgi:5-methylthioadenosine/S-adenosylhomocysteine deaminase